ncbi:proline-, glutamic acid- and leucine-rich protein 1-like isoform X2 [Salvia hispanica]|uniref:proline-, glutamic acid- and leucine-rich protein 1-like isoform X2 n=1 Tax=Salvia hispanica TaxID=49212 RepID=UPI002009B370|nr:proline-, glutamic acid- and leucine-rich protein 1-like isoform X2 [Salvia hispanica]
MGEDISMVEEEEIAAAAAVNAAEEVVVEEEEEDDDDDGPPPGFQCILTLQPPDYDDEDEEDGPPPGFDFVAPEPPQLLPSSDMTSSKQDDMDEDDDDDDDDGPPPGWEFGKLVNALENTTPGPIDVKEESNEDLDEGPPPGWESVLPCQMPQPQTPPLQPPSTVSSIPETANLDILDCEMGSKPKTTEMDDEMHQSESEKMPTPGQSSPATPPTQQLLLSEQPSVNNEEENKNEEKRPTPMLQPASPLQQLQSKPHSLTPVPKSSSSEKAQLVCGTCRKLCLYPQGAKWIRCPGCQEVNFVLAAHEVGQVNCGGCAVLLMYPHGAPAVQCSSCRFVTEIGAHNRRPPLSIQQAQARDQRRRRRSTGVR